MTDQEVVDAVKASVPEGWFLVQGPLIEFLWPVHEKGVLTSDLDALIQFGTEGTPLKPGMVLAIRVDPAKTSAEEIDARIKSLIAKYGTTKAA